MHSARTDVMHVDQPGYECREGCGSEWPSAALNRGLPLTLHTAVPIEAIGVVHITTAPSYCPAGFWHSDVILWRYRDGAVIEQVHLTGSHTPAYAAQAMHMYWCDLETLILCVRGDPSGVHPSSDPHYHDRKLGEIRCRRLVFGGASDDVSVA